MYLETTELFISILENTASLLRFVQQTLCVECSMIYNLEYLVVTLEIHRVKEQVQG